MKIKKINKTNKPKKTNKPNKWVTQMKKQFIVQLSFHDILEINQAIRDKIEDFGEDSLKSGEIKFMVKTNKILDGDEEPITWH